MNKPYGNQQNFDVLSLKQSFTHHQSLLEYMYLSTLMSASTWEKITTLQLDKLAIFFQHNNIQESRLPRAKTPIGFPQMPNQGMLDEAECKYVQIPLYKHFCAHFCWQAGGT